MGCGSSTVIQPLTSDGFSADGPHKDSANSKRKNGTNKGKLKDSGESNSWTSANPGSRDGVPNLTGKHASSRSKSKTGKPPEVSVQDSAAPGQGRQRFKRSMNAPEPETTSPDSGAGGTLPRPGSRNMLAPSPNLRRRSMSPSLSAIDNRAKSPSMLQEEARLRESTHNNVSNFEVHSILKKLADISDLQTHTEQSGEDSTESQQSHNLEKISQYCASIQGNVSFLHCIIPFIPTCILHQSLVLARFREHKPESFSAGMEEPVGAVCHETEKHTPLVAHGSVMVIELIGDPSRASTVLPRHSSKPRIGSSPSPQTHQGSHPIDVIIDLIHEYGGDVMDICESQLVTVFPASEWMAVSQRADGTYFPQHMGSYPVQTISAGSFEHEDRASGSQTKDFARPSSGTVQMFRSNTIAGASGAILCLMAIRRHFVPESHVSEASSLSQTTSARSVLPLAENMQPGLRNLALKCGIASTNVHASNPSEMIAFSSFMNSSGASLWQLHCKTVEDAMSCAATGSLQPGKDLELIICANTYEQIIEHDAIAPPEVQSRCAFSLCSEQFRGKSVGNYWQLQSIADHSPSIDRDALVHGGLKHPGFPGEEMHPMSFGLACSRRLDRASDVINYAQQGIDFACGIRRYLEQFLPSCVLHSLSVGMCLPVLGSFQDQDHRPITEEGSEVDSEASSDTTLDPEHTFTLQGENRAGPNISFHSIISSTVFVPHSNSVVVDLTLPYFDQLDQTSTVTIISMEVSDSIQKPLQLKLHDRAVAEHEDRNAIIERSIAAIVRCATKHRICLTIFKAVGKRVILQAIAGIAPYSHGNCASIALMACMEMSSECFAAGSTLNCGIVTGTLSGKLRGNLRRCQWGSVGTALDIASKVRENSQGRIICDWETRQRVLDTHILQFSMLPPDTFGMTSKHQLQSSKANQPSPCFFMVSLGQQQQHMQLATLSRQAAEHSLVGQNNAIEASRRSVDLTSDARICRAIVFRGLHGMGKSALLSHTALLHLNKFHGIQFLQDDIASGIHIDDDELPFGDQFEVPIVLPSEGDASEVNSPFSGMRYAVALLLYMASICVSHSNEVRQALAKVAPKIDSLLDCTMTRIFDVPGWKVCPAWFAKIEEANFSRIGLLHRRAQKLAHISKFQPNGVPMSQPYDNSRDTGSFPEFRPAKADLSVIAEEPSILSTDRNDVPHNNMTPSTAGILSNSVGIGASPHQRTSFGSSKASSAHRNTNKLQKMGKPTASNSDDTALSELDDMQDSDNEDEFASQRKLADDGPEDSFNAAHSSQNMAQNSHTPLQFRKMPAFLEKPNSESHVPSIISRLLEHLKQSVVEQHISGKQDFALDKIDVSSIISNRFSKFSGKGSDSDSDRIEDSSTLLLQFLADISAILSSTYSVKFLIAADDYQHLDPSSRSLVSVLSSVVRPGLIALSCLTNETFEQVKLAVPTQGVSVLPLSLHESRTLILQNIMCSKEQEAIDLPLSKLMESEPLRFKNIANACGGIPIQCIQYAKQVMDTLNVPRARSRSPRLTPVPDTKSNDSEITPATSSVQKQFESLQPLQKSLTIAMAILGKHGDASSILFVSQIANEEMFESKNAKTAVDRPIVEELLKDMLKLGMVREGPPLLTNAPGESPYGPSYWLSRLEFRKYVTSVIPITTRQRLHRQAAHHFSNLPMTIFEQRAYSETLAAHWIASISRTNGPSASQQQKVGDGSLSLKQASDHQHAASRAVYFACFAASVHQNSGNQMEAFKRLVSGLEVLPDIQDEGMRDKLEIKILVKLAPFVLSLMQMDDSAKVLSYIASRLNGILGLRKMFAHGANESMTDKERKYGTSIQTAMSAHLVRVLWLEWRLACMQQKFSDAFTKSKQLAKLSNFPGADQLKSDSWCCFALTSILCASVDAALHALREANQSLADAAGVDHDSMEPRLTRKKKLRLGDSIAAVTVPILRSMAQFMKGDVRKSAKNWTIAVDQLFAQPLAAVYPTWWLDLSLVAAHAMHPEDVASACRQAAQHLPFMQLDGSDKILLQSISRDNSVISASRSFVNDKTKSEALVSHISQKTASSFLIRLAMAWSVCHSTSAIDGLSILGTVDQIQTVLQQCLSLPSLIAGHSYYFAVDVLICANQLQQALTLAENGISVYKKTGATFGRILLLRCKGHIWALKSLVVSENSSPESCISRASQAFDDCFNTSLTYGLNMLALQTATLWVESLLVISDAGLFALKTNFTKPAITSLMKIANKFGIQASRLAEPSSNSQQPAKNELFGAPVTNQVIETSQSTLPTLKDSFSVTKRVENKFPSQPLVELHSSSKPGLSNNDKLVPSPPNAQKPRLPTDAVSPMRGTNVASHGQTSLNHGRRMREQLAPETAASRDAAGPPSQLAVSDSDAVAQSSLGAAIRKARHSFRRFAKEPPLAALLLSSSAMEGAGFHSPADPSLDPSMSSKYQPSAALGNVHHGDLDQSLHSHSTNKKESAPSAPVIQTSAQDISTITDMHVESPDSSSSLLWKSFSLDTLMRIRLKSLPDHLKVKLLQAANLPNTMDFGFGSQGNQEGQTPGRLSDMHVRFGMPLFEAAAVLSEAISLNMHRI